MASASNIPPPVAFNIAFERLKEMVSKDDARSFNSTSLEDVWTTAREIERHLESRRSLRGFRRIQPFLTGIEQYSKIVEVLCQGTPYLPYIWAPIKLLLQIAQGHLAALEKLVDAYAMIGEAMPRFDRLSATFKDDPEFQQVMGHFYEDILEFHRRAYMFFRRRFRIDPAWKIVFDSLWKNFNLRFHGILENLRKHRDLIDAEANAIGIAEAKAWRNTQLDQIRKWRVERAYDIEKMERERLASQTKEAVAWFGANEGQEDTFEKLTRACDGSDGHWILKEPIIVTWLGQSGREPSVVWLNGKLGAGKSVICSKIVEHVQDSTDTTIIYFFFQHHQIARTQVSEVLRSFATQLLAANAGLAPYILETFANNGQKPTKKNLGVILEKMIASLPSLRIVVDGLDECLQDDQDEIMQDLLKIKGPVPGSCRILISSRKLRSISKWLHSKPTVRLDNNIDNINSTISSFIDPRLQSLRDHFGLDIIDGLKDLLLAKANGMFLWVRLVMFTLLDLHYESHVREAIEALPEDLEAVYERIFSHLCGDGTSHNQRIKIRILQWMQVARRPMKRCELESGISLNEQVSQITTATRPRGDVLSLCFPILEVEDEPGGLVNFVHFTAQEYLRKTDKFALLQPQQAQLTVSLSCVLYLQSSLNFVDPRIAEDENRSRVALCLHELHLYAIDYWVDHLLALVASLGSPCGAYDIKTLVQSLEEFADTHNCLAASQSWSVRDETESSSTPPEHRWQPLDISLATRRLLDRVLLSRETTSSDDQESNVPYSSPDEHQDPTLFSRIRGRYQIIVEELMEMEEPTDNVLSDFKGRQSSGAFLCSYRGCSRATQGFKTSELRQKHEEHHRPRFQCTHAECGFLGWTFGTRAAMKKHTSQYHDKENTTSIPDSLIRRLHGSDEDRSLFFLHKATKSLSPLHPRRGRIYAQQTETAIPFIMDEKARNYLEAQKQAQQQQQQQTQQQQQQQAQQAQQQAQQYIITQRQATQAQLQQQQTPQQRQRQLRAQYTALQQIAAQQQQQAQQQAQQQQQTQQQQQQQQAQFPASDSNFSRTL